MQKNRMRLHLAHGTWPKGIFHTKHPWTEPGSGAYKSLQSKLPLNTQLESFTWAGKNTMNARSKGADELRSHLRQSLSKHPDDYHIILAHSHGGTIATKAVSDCELDGKVRCLICLATPFIYLSAKTTQQRFISFSAIGSTALAILWTVLLAIPRVWESLRASYLLFFGALVLIAVLALVAAAALMEPRGTILQEGGPNKTPIFLLIGLRDKVFLFFDGVKYFDMICTAFARINSEISPSIHNALDWMVKPIAIGVLPPAIGFLLASAFMPYEQIDPLWMATFVVYALAFTGMQYLVGRMFIGLCVGHSNIHQWPQSDVKFVGSPPNTTCKIIKFKVLDTSVLQHALYEDELVLDRVVAVARDI